MLSPVIAGGSAGGGGSGTVTSVSVVTANGVSGSVATSTTTPAITLILGAITPTSMSLTGRLQTSQGIDVASAGDVTLGADGNIFEITGAVTINALIIASWQNGSVVTLLFTSTPTIKHNTAGGAGTAVMLLAGSVDFLPSAGSRLSLLLSEIGGIQAWREIQRTTP